jgi:hypothetical protein
MAFRLQIEMIETYNDFSYIMYIICDMTASYYSRIKNIVNIPIIICSTGLSILNTTELSDSSFDKIVIIRNCGIAFNLLIALSIAILNAYKITEKEFSFKSQSVNFLKIHNKINVDLAKCRNTMSQVDILDIVKEYNLLCESICFHIPSHIQAYVKRNYRNYKQPFMLSRPKKERRTSIISYYFNKDDSGKSYDSNESSTNLSVTSSTSALSLNNTNNTNNTEETDLEYGYLPQPQDSQYRYRLSPIPSVYSVPDTKRNNKRKKKSPINALNSKFRRSFKIKKDKERVVKSKNHNIQDILSA